jgi:uncharacterized protein (TIGR02246 family)
MKNTVLFLLVLLQSSFLTLNAQMDDPAILAAENAVHKFFAHDNEGYAACFAPQGQLVNPLGMQMQTPAGIIAGHEVLFNHYWKDLKSQADIQTKTVRYLQPDLALVTFTVEAWHTKEGTEVDRGKYTASSTLKKHDSGWLIEYFQVTPIVVPPTEG